MAVGNDAEIYPNSPLVDVICEVKFPGEMQVECDRHTFWNQIRDTYPTILVPKVTNGQAIALQHYRLRSADKKRTVSIALNSLAFSETPPYSGHTSFLEEFVRLAKIFQDCYPGLNKVNRIGWRYINVIPFSKGAGPVPVSDFLKVSVALPTNLFESAQTFDARFESKTDEGTVITRLAIIGKNVSQTDDDIRPAGDLAILLDIDYVIEKEDLKFRHLESHLQRARKNGREIFEELITDNYRKYLRGDTL